MTGFQRTAALGVMIAWLATVAALAEVAAEPTLEWDAVQKVYNAKLGEPSANVMFIAKNAGASPVTITAIEPSCGCTTVAAPPLPWTLAPGEQGPFTATVDLKDKRGELTKTIAVESGAGRQTLRVVVRIPAPPPLSPAERMLARQALQADRQAVFHGRCAVCHAEGLADLEGRPLFEAACGICHLSPHRAEMVPDLAVAREPRDYAFWWKWISEGRAGSLMPAFAQDHGGVLDDDQVWSLALYALKTFPGTANPNSTETKNPNPKNSR